MAIMTYIDAINAALHEEMERAPGVFVLGEDVGKMGGAFRATKGLLEKFGSERVMDTPLAEGVIVSSSIGAAMMGMRPVPEIQFVDFITPAMDALTQQAAKLRYRSAGTQTCPITVRVCYGGNVGGGLSHSQSNTSWFIHCPGLVVVAPSTPYDAKGMLKAAIRRQGTDITAISYGYTLQLTLQAAEQMKKKHNVDVEVVDLRTLAPLDTDTFLKSVAKTSRAVIIHEDNRTLGIGAEVAATIAEQAFDCLDAPILRVTAPDVPLLPAAAELERFCVISVEM